MQEKHTLELFDLDLMLLREIVHRLADQAAEELERAVQALLENDPALARKVVASDLEADRLHEMIHHHMTIVLARQQAMAEDLREILAAGRIATCLERLADYAKNTARRMQVLTMKVDEDVAAQFLWMGARVGAMLSQVMRAYRERDAGEANVAWSSDAELDRVYGELFAHLLERMQRDSSSIGDATQLLFIAKGLERAGDHVTNIAEEVYLMVTGKPLQGPRPKVETIAPH
ncbi:MAG: phosphate signaling complex protein PhoU [Gallionella sp.]|nr:phosphate signaling complex protein PhoU [Gallionella sp.]